MDLVAAMLELAFAFLVVLDNTDALHFGFGYVPQRHILSVLQEK
jgi:hypothetical protein